VLSKLGGAKLAERAAASLKELGARNWSAQRAKKTQAAAALSGKSPLSPDWLMMRLSDTLPADAVIVDEGLTTAFSLLSFYPYRDRHSYFGNVTGGIGWGIAAAVGIQLALPQRKVVAVIGDGSAMYSIQAIWSAAHYKAPLVFLIANNGGYRIIKQRLKSFHGNEKFIGMDFQDPPIDMSALARAMGVPAKRAATPAEFDAALAEALSKSDGPCLIEVMVEKSV
jgi:benzoylformate decarboxylase